MKNETERKRQTQDKVHNILNIVGKVIGIGLWASLIIVCIVNRDKITAEGIVGLVPQNSWLSAIILLMLFAVKSVSVVIYSGILYAASGILFSLPIAIIINIIGTVIMVTIPYLIGRKAGTPMLERLVAKKTKLAIIRDFPSQNDLFVSFFVRIVGCLPGDLVCMYLGADRLNYPRYLIGSVLGSMSAVISFAVMGMNADDITSPGFLISLGIEFLLMVGSIVFGLVFSKRRKRNSEKYDRK